MDEERRAVSAPDDLDLPPDATPEPVRLISDTETLRAISDPTRMRLLETMVQRLDPPWSVKELAAALGVPQTRLYHHVEQLLAHDLVRAVERRVVSGIIETRYRVAATSFQLDRRLFAGEDDAAATLRHQALTAVFDTARDEIEAAMRSGAIDPEGSDAHRRMTVSRSLVRLSPARADELHRRLEALVAEFGEVDDPDGIPLGLVIAAYRLPPATKEPTDG
jgi:DNA-binding transcriptional ArsR family regulator